MEKRDEMPNTGAEEEKKDKKERSDRDSYRFVLWAGEGQRICAKNQRKSFVLKEKAFPRVPVVFG